MHPSLLHVCICVTFHWNPLNLIVLQATLNALAAYPTNVTVSVICNEARKLNKVLDAWSEDGVTGAQNTVDAGHTFAIEAVGPKSALAHPHDLAWTHREVFAEMATRPHYTLFMLVEEDKYVPFSALESWAEDTDLLRSSRSTLQRGFYRTVFNSEGEIRLSDAMSQVEATTSTQLMISHRLFAQMPYPYSAMWVADKVLMSKFMQSSEWEQDRASPVWGSREMAAGSIQFLDLPNGFFSAWVVPLHPDAMCPFSTAAIRHASNKGPRVPGSVFGSIPVCDAFS